jgi:hypothetical protein
MAAEARLNLRLVLADTGEERHVRVTEAETGVALLRQEARALAERHPAFRCQQAALGSAVLVAVQAQDLVLLEGEPPHRSLEDRARSAPLRGTVFCYDTGARARYAPDAVSAASASGPGSADALSALDSSPAIEACLLAGSCSGPGAAAAQHSAARSACLELRNQGAALRAAIASVTVHADVCQHGVGKQIAEAAKARQEYSALRAGLEASLAALAAVRVPAALQSAYARHGVAVAVEAAAAAAAAVASGDGRTMSLLDCVKRDTLDSWVGECERLDTVIGEQVGQLSTMAAAMSETALALREQHEDLALVAAAAALPSGGAGGASTSCSSAEAATACSSQYSAATASAVCARACELRRAMARAHRSTFERVMRVQTDMLRLEKRLVRLKQGVDGQRLVLARVHAVARLPQAFEASLLEIRRRRAFANSYRSEAARVAEELARLAAAEATRRDDFYEESGRWLPPGLLPGLAPECSVVPLCELRLRPFDQALQELDLDEPLTPPSQPE